MYRAISAFIFLCLLTVTPVTVYAQKSYYEKQFEPFLTRGETTWSVSVGAKQNNIDWSAGFENTGIAGPNVDREQTWTDVRTVQLKGDIRHVEPADIAFIRGGIQMEAELTGGFTLDGRSRLSSYLGNNRTFENTRQTAGSVDGDAIGAKAAVGYKIMLTGTPDWKTRRILRNKIPSSARKQALRDRALRRSVSRAGPAISIAPILGYTIDQHSYHREDAFNHFPLPELDVGPFHTESDYIANWYGPVFGLEGQIRTHKHMFTLRGEYQNLTFYGKGIEPSRADDFEQDPTYDHEIDGDGFLLKAQYAYALGDDYAITFDAMYQEREAEDGTYKIYPLDADAFTLHLNEVRDKSQAVHIGLRYNWN